MTRGLRKRHLKVWLVLTVAMIFLIAYARNNTPIFEGDHSDVINKK